MNYSNLDGQQPIFRRIYSKLFKAPLYLYYFAKAFLIFKNPIQMIYCYIFRTIPPNNVVRLRRGFQIFLSDHPSDVVSVFVVFIKKDYGNICRGSEVIDIGANIGSFSIYAAFHGARKIYAYEPNKEAYKALVRNIKVNKLENTIVAKNLAVSDKSNEIVQIPVSSSPLNQVSFDVKTEMAGYEIVRTINVESIFADNHIDNIDVFKIDCEGCEYNLFFNMQKSVFEKIRNIRMEYHYGPNDRLFTHFESHNFKITCILKNSSCLHAVQI